MNFYSEPLFRPPSEAESLILQITQGCSHNKCVFCSMYKGKSYSEKSLSQAADHIAGLKNHWPDPRRIFLADGNALGMETQKLLSILSLINQVFPSARRISAYASPLDLLEKSPEELEKIRRAGLKLLYLGVESGNDAVLAGNCKGADSRDMITAGRRAVDGDYLLSCMIISGLGGRKLTREHALDSARVISAINPRYLSLLTLMIPGDQSRNLMAENYGFEEMEPEEILAETRLMVENLELTDCVFRSNHASNYLPLGGVLDRDRDLVLKAVDAAMKNHNFRPGRFRRL